MKTALFALLMLSALPALAMDPDLAKPIFEKQELSLAGRLRHLTLERLGPSAAKSIVILERKGEYPDWSVELSAWSFDAAGRKVKLDSTTSLPSDTLFYGFVQRRLILLRIGAVEAWKQGPVGFEADPKYRAEIKPPFAVRPAGDVVPFDPVPGGTDGPGALFFAPTANGLAAFSLEADRLKKLAEYPSPLRAFYQSDSDNRPFDLSFWLRGSIWYPRGFIGSTGDLAKKELLWPWMDEVAVVPFEKPSALSQVRMLRFGQLTEEERDDGKSYVVVTPVDLNHDGRLDFLVNKFQGSATTMSAETTLFHSRPDGSIPAKGERLIPQDNRAGGALATDLNKDGRMDLVVASTQYNTWAVIRALIRRVAKVNFSFYLQHPDGFRLGEPDLTHEIAFQFNLDDADIDGLLPTLDGDFNGDGFVDALYAKDRRAVTVLLQRPKEKAFFPMSSIRSFEVPVPRRIRVGDLNGDGRSDAVLFDRRANGNRKVTVLINTGVLK